MMIKIDIIISVYFCERIKFYVDKRESVDELLSWYFLASAFLPNRMTQCPNP